MLEATGYPNGVSSPVEGGDAAAGLSLSLSPPSDPQALPRLGWYLYLLTKDVLGFRTSNASFVRCLNLVLAALGAVVWNSSPRFSSLSSLHASPQHVGGRSADGCNSGSEEGGVAVAVEGNSPEGVGAGSVGGVDKAAASPAAAALEEEAGGAGMDMGVSVGAGTGIASECAGGAGGGRGGDGNGDGGGGGGVDGDVGGGVGGFGYGGEAALLVALSACGKCPADEVRAMSARVVEVLEVLLREGIVVSHTSSCSTPNPATAAVAAADGGDSAPEAADRREVSPAGAGTGVDPAGDVAGIASPVTGRAERVAGVFHASVAAENASRLDSCYWARVSERAGRGGVGVLDEAFVLTPGLRWDGGLTIFFCFVFF